MQQLHNLRKFTGRAVIACLLLLAAWQPTNGQTAVAAGQIAIIAWDADASTGATHAYQWVTLVPLTAGTVLRFSDACFLSTSTSNSSSNAKADHMVMWTNSTGSTIAAGTIITMTGTSYSSPTVSIGSLSFPTTTGIGDPPHLL